MKHRLCSMIGAAAAVLLAVALAVPGAAFAITTEKATARPNEDGGDAVLGGIATRLTWEGTVDPGEEVSSVTLELPEDGHEKDGNGSVDL